MSPELRLVLRALIAGLTVFLTQLQGSTAWDAGLVKAAIVAGVLAVLELLTPLNAVVGLNKTATLVPK